MDANGMTPEQLEAWRAQLEKRLEELDAHVRPLLADKETTRQLLDLVKRLLSLVSGRSEPERRSRAVEMDQLHAGAPIADIIETARHAPLSARARFPAPRFCPTKVEAATAKPSAVRYVIDSSRLPIPIERRM